MHEHSIASHSKVWLMHTKVFKRESQANNEHTVAVLCEKRDFILLHHFFYFLYFLIRNLIHFFLFLLLQNPHHHAYSRHHTN